MSPRSSFLDSISRSQTLSQERRLGSLVAQCHPGALLVSLRVYPGGELWVAQGGLMVLDQTHLKPWDPEDSGEPFTFHCE